MFHETRQQPIHILFLCLRAFCNSLIRLVVEKMADDKDIVEKTIAEDLVVTKYKMAGEIVNSELKYTLFKQNQYVIPSFMYVFSTTPSQAICSTLLPVKNHMVFETVWLNYTIILLILHDYYTQVPQVPQTIMLFTFIQVYTFFCVDCLQEFLNR